MHTFQSWDSAAEAGTGRCCELRVNDLVLHLALPGCSCMDDLENSPEFSEPQVVLQDEQSNTS